MSKHRLDELVQSVNNQLLANDTTREAANEHKRLDLQLRAVCECDYSIVHATDEKELFSKICQILCVTARYKLAWVGMVLTDKNKSLHLFVCFDADDQVQKNNLTWVETEGGQGSSAMAVCTGKTQVVKDLTAEPTMVPRRDAALEMGYRSCASFPLSKNGNIFAVLSLYSSIPNSFSPHVVRLLETLIGNIEYAVTAIDENKQRQLAESEIAHLATLAEFDLPPIAIPVVTSLL